MRGALILLCAVLLLTVSIVVAARGRVQDAADIVDRNTDSIARNCASITTTRDELRRQFSLAIEDDISRVAAFIQSNPSAPTTSVLKSSLGKLRARKADLHKDFPDPRCKP